MKMRTEAKTENAQALCKEEMKREETFQHGRKKETQQAGDTKPSQSWTKQRNRWHKTRNMWHKTKPKLEGYKMTKKSRK